MERGSYLPNEPDKLMTLYSTIDRKRGTTELWMVGNSISRVCPYISAWGLDEIFRTIKQGEIKTKIHNDANDVKIAVEYCRASGGKTMAIGNASSMIDKGGWQTLPQPKLPKSLKEYKCLYRFGFQYKNFKFLCDYLVDKVEKECCFFIYPKYTEFKNNTIIFSDVVKVDRHFQRDIYNISIPNEKLRKFFQKFFKQVIDFLIRR